MWQASSRPMPRSLGARAASGQAGAAAVRADVLLQELFHPLHALFVLHLGKGVFHRVDRVEIGEVQLRRLDWSSWPCRRCAFSPPGRCRRSPFPPRSGPGRARRCARPSPGRHRSSATTSGVFQGATAPSSMVRDSSGTRVARSTVRTMPVPPQVRQAPWLLKASSSAPGA